jgi:hypothetical protein
MFSEKNQKSNNLGVRESKSISQNSSVNNSYQSKETMTVINGNPVKSNDFSSPSIRKEYSSNRSKKYGFNKLKSKTGREKKKEKVKKKKMSSVVESKNILNELVNDKIYFKNPQQLIQKFSDLEERNLFLIEKNQDNEQAYFELKKKFETTKEEKTLQIKELKTKREYLLKKIRGMLLIR